MPEPMADIQHEGIKPFSAESENDNSESSPDETNETDKNLSPDGEKKNNQDDPNKDKPFHEHPRWKERETEWETRFNEQEKRHQDDLKAIREEFGKSQKDNSEQTKIPSWFGGDQEQWDAYRADRAQELKEAEERAINRITQAKSSEEKAVKEATDYMQSEITSIESDKTLNPTGAKIDPNKLLKIVMDNDLIDSKGRWNYKAGFRLMNVSEKTGAFNERKNIAGATTSETKGETKPANFKTSADFKQNRPW